MELAKQKYLSGKKVESGVRPNINFFESSQSIVEYSENPYENDPLNPESY